MGTSIGKLDLFLFNINMVNLLNLYNLFIFTYLIHYIWLTQLAYMAYLTDLAYFSIHSHWFQIYFQFFISKLGEWDTAWAITRWVQLQLPCCKALWLQPCYNRRMRHVTLVLKLWEWDPHTLMHIMEILLLVLKVLDWIHVIVLHLLWVIGLEYRWWVLHVVSIFLWFLFTHLRPTLLGPLLLSKWWSWRLGMVPLVVLYNDLWKWRHWFTLIP